MDFEHSRFSILTTRLAEFSPSPDLLPFTLSEGEGIHLCYQLWDFLYIYTCSLCHLAWLWCGLFILPKHNTNAQRCIMSWLFSITFVIPKTSHTWQMIKFYQKGPSGHIFGCVFNNITFYIYLNCFRVSWRQNFQCPYLVLPILICFRVKKRQTFHFARILFPLPVLFQCQCPQSSCGWYCIASEASACHKPFVPFLPYYRHWDMPCFGIRSRN